MTPTNTSANSLGINLSLVAYSSQTRTFPVNASYESDDDLDLLMSLDQARPLPIACSSSRLTTAPLNGRISAIRGSATTPVSRQLFSPSPFPTTFNPPTFISHAQLSVLPSRQQGQKRVHDDEENLDESKENEDVILDVDASDSIPAGHNDDSALEDTDSIHQNKRRCLKANSQYPSQSTFMTDSQ